ncbi:MAG TPA: response regulator [Pyrinomonadaceae bacterium]
MRILLVEDEPSAALMLAKGLREQSYAVDIAADGEVALYQLSVCDYDLVILDVMLPHKDGLQVCREMRDLDLSTPVLMLTARDAVDDRIAGLDSGADDYLIKPISFSSPGYKRRASCQTLNTCITNTVSILRILDVSAVGQYAAE